MDMQMLSNSHKRHLAIFKLELKTLANVRIAEFLACLAKIV